MLEQTGQIRPEKRTALFIEVDIIIICMMNFEQKCLVIVRVVFEVCSDYQPPTRGPQNGDFYI